jgi:hypothetical protein
MSRLTSGGRCLVPFTCNDLLRQLTANTSRCGSALNVEITSTHRDPSLPESAFQWRFSCRSQTQQSDRQSGRTN